MMSSDARQKERPTELRSSSMFRHILKYGN